MEFIPVDVQLPKLLVGHLDAPLILVWVQPALDAQPALGGRRLYQADDHRQRHQGPAAPVLADVAEHSVLDLVPLRGPRRQVRDVDLQPRLVGELLQRLLPQPVPAAVAAPAVARDVELAGIPVPVAAHLVPPAPDALHGEGGRVAADAHAHIPLVLPHVVDAVGGGLAEAKDGEVVVEHQGRLAGGQVLAPLVGEVAHQLLLLCIHRDYRLAVLHEGLGLVVYVAELGVTVDVLFAHLEGLLVLL